MAANNLLLSTCTRAAELDNELEHGFPDDLWRRVPFEVGYRRIARLLQLLHCAGSLASIITAGVHELQVIGAEITG